MNNKTNTKHPTTWGARTITLIIIHCSAVRPDQTSSAAQIDLWHRQRGWKMIGYHYVIRRDGTIENGRPEEMVGAHCKDHNRHSIGICYEGGLRPSQPPLDGGPVTYEPADTRTLEQRAALRALLEELHKAYPRAIIVGHNTIAPKACPCFRPEIEYADLQP